MSKNNENLNVDTNKDSHQTIIKLSNEMIYLNQRLTEIEKENKDLNKYQEKINHVENDFASLNERISELAYEIAGLKEKNIEIEKENNSLNEKNTTLVTELISLKELNVELDDATVNFFNKIAELENECQILKEKIPKEIESETIEEQKVTIRRKCPKCGNQNPRLMRETIDKTNVISDYPRMYGKKYKCGQCGGEW